MKSKLINDVKIGYVFGDLKVIGEPEIYKKKYAVNCLCSCGKEKLISIYSLLDGMTTSCGCRRLKAVTKHGLSTTTSYRSWQDMHYRCYNKDNIAYYNYGGRGIKVCERWSEPDGFGFLNFLNDMGMKPDDSYTLDRIDVNGNYEPSNCRWATSLIQARNKRLSKRNTTGHAGVYDRNDYTYSKPRYRANIRVNKKTIDLGTFDTVEEAILARKEAESKYWN